MRRRTCTEEQRKSHHSTEQETNALALCIQPTSQGAICKVRVATPLPAYKGKRAGASTDACNFLRLHYQQVNALAFWVTKELPCFASFRVPSLAMGASLAVSNSASMPELTASLTAMPVVKHKHSAVRQGVFRMQPFELMLAQQAQRTEAWPSPSI